jgi:hypothetical protein
MGHSPDVKNDTMVPAYAAKGKNKAITILSLLLVKGVFLDFLVLLCSVVGKNS